MEDQQPQQQKLINTLQTFDTEYSADSIEWCPIDGYQEYFVCGTYQLLEDENINDKIITKRKGRIYLMNYKIDENELNLIDTKETASILDQKWLTGLTFGACNGLGEIQIYTIENNTIELIKSKNLNTEVNDLLALSFDYCNKNENLIVSDSKGNVSLIKCTNNDLIIERTWSAHIFEAWTCAFDKQNENIIYTGGDDTFLNIYDIRCSTDDQSQLIVKNKSHGAGVTSILSFKSSQYQLATGSYDEILRIFDTRNLKQTTNELNLSGGIWRLKSNPFNELLILNACMYHNFSVVQLFSDSINNIQLISEYFEHKSICYGNDWSHKYNKNFYYLATCSFYDHKLNISSLEY